MFGLGAWLLTGRLSVEEGVYSCEFGEGGGG